MTRPTMPDKRRISDVIGSGLTIRRNCPTHGPSNAAGGAFRFVRRMGRMWVCAKCKGEPK
jgi:hypothetical protein